MGDEQVLRRLKKAVEEAGGQRAFAAKHGLSAPFINDVLHRRRGFSDAICNALGLVRHVTYSVKYSEKKP